MMNEFNMKEVIMECLLNLNFMVWSKLKPMYEGYIIGLELQCNEDAQCLGYFSFKETNCTHVPYQFEDWVFMNIDNKKIRDILLQDKNMKSVFELLENIQEIKVDILNLVYDLYPYQEPDF